MTVVVPRPTDASEHHVYFVQIGADGPIKIGRSSDVAARVAVLQTACPTRLRLLGVAIYGGSRLEARLHATLSASRIRGEWFRPDPFVLDVVGDHITDLRSAS